MTTIDKLSDFAITKLNSVFDTVSKALPTVAKYTLQVTEYGCIINILQGVALLVCSILVGLASYRLYVYGKDKYDSDPVILLSMIAGLGALILLITSLSFLTDFWEYVCIVHPDLYLIHLTIQKITS